MREALAPSPPDAGPRSERVHKTNASGVLLREAKYINTSLHYLEMVIVSLRDRNKGSRQHIPYRNSMMTSVLRDSLGGNCKTTMVATVSGEDPHTDVRPPPARRFPAGVGSRGGGALHGSTDERRRRRSRPVWSSCPGDDQHLSLRPAGGQHPERRVCERGGRPQANDSAVEGRSQVLETGGRVSEGGEGAMPCPSEPLSLRPHRALTLTCGRGTRRRRMRRRWRDCGNWWRNTCTATNLRRDWHCPT